jgi:iron complex outermembrane receptor protein
MFCFGYGRTSLARRVGTALITLCAMAAGALAATPSDNDQLQIEEIVVSATRLGEQDLQKTAIAMSVISPVTLDNKGLGSIADFVGLLPSVNMQSTSPGVNQIDMRGLSTTTVDPTNAQERSLVALYLDDASITQQAYNPDLHVYDLERVEVIRGPQGTLYGAGSMAGTIRLITKKPDTNQFSASADVSVSDTDRGGANYSIRGMVNLPLIDDRLGARITAYRSSDSGYIDNIELNDRHSNPAYSTQARAVIRWRPIDSLTIDTSATLERLDALGRYDVYPNLGNYVFETLSPEKFTDDFKLFNITADWDVSFAHLISSTSYLRRWIVETETYQYFNEYYLTPGILEPGPNWNTNDLHQFQEELRLVSRPDQPLRWTAGAYFERYARFYPQTQTSENFDKIWGEEIGDPTFSSNATYPPTPNNAPFYGTIAIVEKQYALFGEATYSITPKLDATLGVRYFNFTDNFNLFFTGVAGAIAPGEPVTEVGEQKSTGANPRGVLSYKVTDDFMVYGEAARGFRYGGVNEPAPLAFCGEALAAVGLKQSPLTFGPDHLWSYTLGEKSKVADGRLLLNVDGFYIDWKDVQTIFDLNCGYYFAQNKGAVKSEGLEFETKLRATAALTLGLNGSYTDARANGPITNLGATSGESVPYFPKTILDLSGDYDIPLQRGKIFLSVDYTYRSDSFTEFNPANPLYREIPVWKMLNASVGYKTSRWSAELYGTNLTNNHLVSLVVANSLPGVQPGDEQFWGRPLTVGVHLHFDF